MDKDTGSGLIAHEHEMLPIIISNEPLIMGCYAIAALPKDVYNLLIDNPDKIENSTEQLITNCAYIIYKRKGLASAVKFLRKETNLTIRECVEFFNKKNIVHSNNVNDNNLSEPYLRR